ncbi:hypothetical protein ACFL27_26190, partial [candidate division CSSED10-310 bacterium]
MPKLTNLCLDCLQLAGRYPTSLYSGIKKRTLFQKIDTFFMFIGYPHSGHSLVGSLLDAHPQIICAYELGVLKYILAGFSKNQIYALILKNSEKFTA